MRCKTSNRVQRGSGSIAPVVRLDDRRRLGTRVHRKQLGSADVLAFPFERLDDGGPRRRRDASALAPLGDGPMTLANVRSHLSDRVPAGEQLFEGFHAPDTTGYKLSRKARAVFPVRRHGVGTDNLRMGRARSPAQFNKEIASRTRAARIAAGFGNAKEFAEKWLGVEYERYKKWEGGRTPIQHEYIARFYELTGKDANYLFDIRPEAAEVRRVGP